VLNDTSAALPARKAVTLADAKTPGAVHLWNASGLTWRFAPRIPQLYGVVPLLASAFSPDGRKLAMVGTDGSVLESEP